MWLGSSWNHNLSRFSHQPNSLKIVYVRISLQRAVIRRDYCSGFNLIVVVNTCLVTEKIKVEEAERWFESARLYLPSRKDFLIDCVIIVHVC